MMRTIKFKGISVEPLAKEDDWLYGSLHINYDDKLAYIDDQPVHFESVCQFTGWKDTEDKEVFEGDYIRFIDLIGDEFDESQEELDTVARVVWCEKDAQFNVSVISNQDEQWVVLPNLYTLEYIKYHLGGFEIIDYNPTDIGITNNDF